jgi:hypothetical protein
MAKFNHVTANSLSITQPLTTNKDDFDVIISRSDDEKIYVAKSIVELQYKFEALMQYMKINNIVPDPEDLSNYIQEYIDSRKLMDVLKEK